MTGRVAMVPLDRAQQLGAEIGLPVPTTSGRRGHGLAAGRRASGRGRGGLGR